MFGKWWDGGDGGGGGRCNIVCVFVQYMIYRMSHPNGQPI